MVAAINTYFQQHPQGVLPGQHYLSDFLKPFVDRELLEARMDELHRSRALRERELLEDLSHVTKICAERIGPHLREEE